MQVLPIIFIFKLVSCTQYYFDVNQLHGPLTELDIQSKTIKYCVHMNNKTLNNNYLGGTWYIIYKFAKVVTGLDSEYCKTIQFSRPTKEDLDGYKAKYDLQNETFTFDNSAILCSTSQGQYKLTHNKVNRTLKGIVVGDKTAKYYFLEPKSTQRLNGDGMYSVVTYKPVNNDYLIYYECSMRGQVKYLWSRRNNQTEGELERVIKPLYELEGMGRDRFCKKRKVVSTTPYF